MLWTDYYAMPKPDTPMLLRFINPKSYTTTEWITSNWFNIATMLVAILSVIAHLYPQ